MVSALGQREMGRGKGDEHNAVDVGVEDAAAEDVERVADVETDHTVSGVKLHFANHIHVNEFKRVPMEVAEGLARPEPGPVAMEERLVASVSAPRFPVSMTKVRHQGPGIGVCSQAQLLGLRPHLGQRANAMHPLRTLG